MKTFNIIFSLLHLATDKPAIEGGEEISLEELDTDDEAEVNICEQKVDKRKKQSNIPQVPESFLDFTRFDYLAVLSKTKLKAMCSY